MVTSILTHFGGLGVAIMVVRKWGIPSYTWLYGVLWGILLQIFSRYFTSPSLNINFSQKVWPGSEAYFLLFGSRFF
ncbi:MAG: hypothetical protein D6785_15480 [Planctomycetota bacterium]|nr:MAG: hypothetical protein D6785_15480 [Planctomycetota bacterium]